MGKATELKRKALEDYANQEIPRFTSEIQKINIAVLVPNGVEALSDKRLHDFVDLLGRSSPLDTDAPGDDAFWLIEKFQSFSEDGKTEWFWKIQSRDGSAFVYIPSFVSDANKAMPFATKKEADNYLKTLPELTKAICFVTEHISPPLDTES